MNKAYAKSFESLRKHKIRILFCPLSFGLHVSQRLSSPFLNVIDLEWF